MTQTMADRARRRGNEMRIIHKATIRAAVVLAALLGIGAAAALATPPLTTIQDQLFRADGTPVNGTLLISWNAFVASDNSNIPTNTLREPVSGGLLRVKLVPTTTAITAVNYTVMYLLDGKLTSTETWSVPPSTSALPLRMVRTSASPVTAPPGDTTIQISDVAGLSDALTERPAKGAGYMPGRILIPDSNGDLSGMNGAADQCVRGDGSLGPCGANLVFIDLETPNGSLNGTNAAFTLSQTPNPTTSLLLFRNGLLQKVGVDFTLTGSSLSFQAGSVPQPGDLLQASYRVSQ
jgi:hypothetical protein